MTDNFDALVIGTGQAGPSMAGRLTDAGLELAVRVFCIVPAFITGRRGSYQR
jgi:cation diffusion facilitator CzcD-associated flavoprotein CzcO